MNFRRFFLAVLLFAFIGDGAAAEEYDFSIPEAEKKPYEVGGRLEARYIYHRLDEDSARSRLNYYRDDPGSDTHEWHALAELSGSLKLGILQAHLLTHHEYIDTYEENEWEHDIYEGYLSLRITPQLTLDAGKKRILWGKGYAWNPAGFLNRPKDPDDPSLSQEGRTFLGIDLIKSFANGQVTNLGLTALLLPVVNDWANSELGDNHDLFVALKLYLLWRDTDIDLIYFDGPDQPRSIGFDFSKNLAENFEIHGELAFRRRAPHTILEADGEIRRTRKDQLSGLLGVRYLNSLDTTFFAEYYHNGGGYDRGEVEDFFSYQEMAFQQWQTTGDTAVMQRANQSTQPFYSQRNFGKDYFYLKISQQEPFDILYFNPWAAVIINLQDYSFNLQTGATWMPITNLELNFRIAIPVGPANTDFGEKPDAVRPEFWARYYF